MIIKQLGLDTHWMEIEKLMIQLPAMIPKGISRVHHRFFFAGHIDCLFSYGHISEDERNTLYAEFAF
jgi:hypothetical protein